MNCTTLESYITEYGSLIADRARQAFEPLHVPSTDAVVELDLKRPMLPAQGHVEANGLNRESRLIERNLFLVRRQCA